MPVWKCKQEIPSGEFAAWMIWMREEEERHKPIDYAIAALTAEVRRSYVDKPKLVKTSDFLLDFEKARALQKSRQSDSRTPMQKSKSFWLGAFGIKE